MSIATLARKSRAQRGASTRTGWTLATTKSGNCPGPCGGGAPAKQHSFRRLMKNKARPGRERSMTCGGGYQRMNGDWVKHTNADPPDSPTGLIGQSFTQTASGVTGILIEAGGNYDSEGYGIFQLDDCQTPFIFSGGGGEDYYLIGVHATLKISRDSVLPVVCIECGKDCCTPVATWKKTNDPKGEQSIGYYLWRKKQLTHNCIPHCIPHREHYNPNYIYVTWTGDTLSGDALHGAKWQRWPVTAPGTAWLDPPWMWAANGGPAAPGGTAGVPPPPHIFFDSQYGQGTGRWVADGGHAELISLHKGVGTHPPTTGWEAAGTPRPDDLKIVWSLPGKVCGYEAPCDNVGCKCNCNKSMGGTACCVVHKTMPPLSNSENIPWVIYQRACLKKAKAAPRNPNTC